MANVKLNVLYPRRYMTNGREQVHWMHVGIAWMTEKGIDVKLWVTPPYNAEGQIALMLREPTREDAERQQAYQQRQRTNQHYERQGVSAPSQPQQEAPPFDNDDQLPF